MKVYTLVQIDFDPMENDINAAIRPRELASFVESWDGPGLKRIETALAELGQQRFYLGSDRQVYPKFRVETRSTS